MSASFKPPGSPSVSRPLSPMISESAWNERIARALEHIVVTLSAIDRKLEIIADRVVARDRDQL